MLKNLLLLPIFLAAALSPVPPGDPSKHCLSSGEPSRLRKLVVGELKKNNKRPEDVTTDSMQNLVYALDPLLLDRETCPSKKLIRVFHEDKCEGDFDKEEDIKYCQEILHAIFVTIQNSQDPGSKPPTRPDAYFDEWFAYVYQWKKWDPEPAETYAKEHAHIPFGFNWWVFAHKHLGKNEVDAETYAKEHADKDFHKFSGWFAFAQVVGSLPPRSADVFAHQHMGKDFDKFEVSLHDWLSFARRCYWIHSKEEEINYAASHCEKDFEKFESWFKYAKDDVNGPKLNEKDAEQFAHAHFHEGDTPPGPNPTPPGPNPGPEPTGPTTDKTPDVDSDKDSDKDSDTDSDKDSDTDPDTNPGVGPTRGPEPTGPNSGRGPTEPNPGRGPTRPNSKYAKADPMTSVHPNSAHQAHLQWCLIVTVVAMAALL